MFAKRMQPSKNTDACGGKGQLTRFERTMSYRVRIMPQRACIECPINNPMKKLLVLANMNTDPPDSVISSIWETYSLSYIKGLIANLKSLWLSSKESLYKVLKVSELLKYSRLLTWIWSSSMPYRVYDTFLSLLKDNSISIVVAVWLVIIYPNFKSSSISFSGVIYFFFLSMKSPLSRRDSGGR